MQPFIENVSARKFVTMVDDLARMSGVEYESALIDQVGALLKVCLRLTPAARREVILKRVDRQNDHVQFPSGHVISIWKKSGNAEMFLDHSTWKRKSGGQSPRGADTGMTWHQMNDPRRRWSDQRWGRYQAYLAEKRNYEQDPKAALRSRGVAKQSWLQIAQDLGVEIGAPQFVKKAMPMNGMTYKNGIARKFLNVAAAYIEISNDNYLVVKRLNGWDILSKAMRIRVKAFGHDMKHKVFDNIALRASRYPGIFIDTTK